MTSRRGLRMSAAWLLAPLAAGSLALGVDWAVQPHPPGAAPTGTPSTRSAVSSVLHQRAQVAARGLQLADAALVRLESTEQQRSDQLNFLRAEVRAIQKARRTGRSVPLPVPNSAPGKEPSTRAPARVAVPPAPPVNATTGAS